MTLATAHAGKKWRIEDIPYNKVDRSLIADDDFMFLTLTAASFVEILSELYSENLIEHFKGNAEIEQWLRDHWREEEVQHGQSLKKYVKTVWPEFDWERAYAGFVAEYSALCTAEQLEQNRSLELVARCVVETGTTSFYRALYNYTREPVLQTLLDNIRADEVSHYTNFRRHLTAYGPVKRHGLFAIARTIVRRVAAVEDEDSYVAIKHACIGKYPDRPFEYKHYRQHNRTTKRLARRYYPFEMAIKMLMKPVPLSDALKRLLQWPLIGFARLLTFT